MKKRFVTVVVLLCSFITLSQENNPQIKTEIKNNEEWTLNPKWVYYENVKHFQFTKIGTSKLETCEDGLKLFLENYKNANYEKLLTKTKDEQNKYFELAKKHYLGATILKTPNDTIGEYIKLNDIPDTDKFELIAIALIEPRMNIVKSERREKPNPFNSSKPEIYYNIIQSIPYFYGEDGYYNTGKKTKVLVQNLKTKLYYILNQDALDFSYQQCEKLSFSTPSSIYKIIPKELSESEKELLSRYKTLIKTAKTKSITLGTIQRKYLTRGYFDPNKVNAVDKKTYNNTLLELKKIAKQLSEIDKEDKNNIAQDKLTIEEIATLSDVNNWDLNFYPIN